MSPDNPVLTPMQVMAIITPWPGTPNDKYSRWVRTYDSVPEITPLFPSDWDLAQWISANYTGSPIPPV